MSIPSNRIQPILVSVRRPSDIDLTKALIEALAPSSSFFLLFAEEGLLERYGHIEHEHGLDVRACMLNPQHFAAIISFSGPRTNSDGDLVLLSYFNRVGVPTIEIQHSLLQNGFGALATGIGAVTARARADRALRSTYEAKTLLAWGGEEGIGYLRSDRVRVEPSFVRNDLILITSALDWEGYTDKERYQFAIAMLRIASAHPERHFVWRARFEERSHTFGAHVLSLIDTHALPNLAIEDEEPVESIMARCHAGIAMPSTSLLDYEICGKPVVVYQCGLTEGLLALEGVRGFRNYFELETLWAPFLDNPQDFRIQLGIPPLHRDRLRERISRALADLQLVGDWQPIAMQYLAYVRESRATQPELSQIASTLSQVSRRLVAVDKRMASVERTVAKLPPRLGKLLERVGVLQRSTLAYKALKLISGRPKSLPSE